MDNGGRSKDLRQIADKTKRKTGARMVLKKMVKSVGEGGGLDRLLLMYCTLDYC